jgi:hypothetical protein
MDDPMRQDLVDRPVKQQPDGDISRLKFQRTSNPVVNEIDDSAGGQNSHSTQHSNGMNDTESNTPDSQRLSLPLQTHHHQQDVVTKGIISDEDARALYQL